LAKDTIPKWFWLVAGVAMAIYAQIILAKTPTMVAMKIFFYVGLLFIAIGIFQIIIKAVFSKPSKRIEREIESEIKKPRFIVNHCPKCGAKNYNTFNYCQNCGCKLN